LGRVTIAPGLKKKSGEEQGGSARRFEFEKGTGEREAQLGNFVLFVFLLSGE